MADRLRRTVQTDSNGRSFSLGPGMSAKGLEADIGTPIEFVR
jgi:hypothetical protein